MLQDNGTTSKRVPNFPVLVSGGLIVLFALDWMLGGHVGAIRQASAYWEAAQRHLTASARQQAEEVRAFCVRHGGRVLENHDRSQPWAWECQGPHFRPPRELVKHRFFEK